MKNKVYMKMTVSFEVDSEDLLKNPVITVKKALKEGATIDGEVYFPMVEANDCLYNSNNNGLELNIDNALDECTITLLE